MDQMAAVRKRNESSVIDQIGDDLLSWVSTEIAFMILHYRRTDRVKLLDGKKKGLFFSCGYFDRVEYSGTQLLDLFSFVVKYLNCVFEKKNIFGKGNGSSFLNEWLCQTMTHIWLT